MKTKCMYVISILSYFAFVFGVHSSINRIGIEFNTLSLTLDGMLTDYYIYNPAAIEEVSNYRERAIDNKLFGANINDVDSYYKSFYKPRTYHINFNVYSSSSITNKTVFSDAGGFRPWDDLSTYISYHDGSKNTFEILHTEKIFFLYDSEYKNINIDCNILFDPGIVINPGLITNIDNVQIQSFGNLYYLKLPVESIINYNIISAEYIADKSGVIQKSLIKYRTTSDSLIDVQYIEVNMDDNGLKPIYFYVNIWRQKLETSGYKGDNPVVPFDYKFNLISNNSINNFNDVNNLKRLEMGFNVSEFAINEPYDDFITWPSVPNGYEYQDDRKRNEQLRMGFLLNDNPNMAVNFKQYKGLGPYTFNK